MAWVPGPLKIGESAFSVALADSPDWLMVCSGVVVGFLKRMFCSSVNGKPSRVHSHSDIDNLS